LCGISSATELLKNSKHGALWESFAIEEIIQAQQTEQTGFYAIHSGSELNLLMEISAQCTGIEFKRADASTATRPM